MTEPEKEKRYWIGFGILLVLLLLFAVFLYRWMGETRKAVDDPYRAVPVDAFLMMETDDFPGVVHTFSSVNRVWLDLSRISGVGDVTRHLRLADSLFGGNRAFYRLFRGGPLVISFHNAGKRGVDLLGVMRLPAGTGEKDVAGDMGSAGAVRMLREYNRVREYTVQFSGEDTPLFFAVKKGLLLISPARILLEKSIRQVDAGGSLLQDRSFSRVRKTAGRNEMMNLYLRADRLPVFLRRWLQGSTYRTLAGVMPVGGWTELDVTAGEQSLLLNGFTLAGDSTGYLLDLLAGGKPAEATILEVIPSAAVSATVLTFGDLNDHLKTLRRYRRQKNLHAGGMPALFREVTGRDAGEVFSSFVTLQAARTELAVRNETPANNTFVVAAVNSGMAARREIDKIIEAYARKKNLASSSMITTVSFDRETKMTVYHFPFAGMPRYLFGSFTGDYPYRYLMITEHYILWGNSVKAVSRFLRFNILQQTLSHDPWFREFTEGMPLRSNLFYFLKLPDAGGFIDRNFSSSFAGSFQAYAKESINVRYLGYEAIAQNGMIYNNLFLQYGQETERRAVTVWESLLDTLFDYKPQLVINHRTRQKEIFLQDLGHRLYLINASGRILWKRPVREQIPGQAWQIDYYRNGKLQLLFNTEHFLYLVDRNGNFVEHFPVSLRSAAAGPLAVFDYGKNKNYRIFIPGRDKRVYAYDKSGNLVPGWKIPQCESAVRGPVRHFVYRGKDYLVFADTMNLYILDRKGHVRIPVTESIVRPARQEIFFAPYPGEGSPSFVVNTTGGEVCFVDLHGRVRRLRFAEVPDDAWFLYEDLNGDGRREFLFLYDDKLQVMSAPGRTFFTRQFKGAVDRFAPVIYTFSQRDKKIGVTDATHGNIYLVNNNGKLYEGFPMEGRTQFSIGRLGAAAGHFNLIVGGNDNFLYNYSVK